MVLRVLIALALAGCDGVTLVDGASEAEVQALRRAGVAARTREERGRRVVEAPGSEVPRAVAALRAMPSEGLAAQGDRPLLATEPEVRARREAALGASAASLLRDLPGVRGARVVVALPPPPRFDELEPARPRAAVRLEGAADVARARDLVVASVAGLRAEDVRVDVTPSPAPAPPPPAWVGPWAVYPSSAGPLRASLVGSLLANVVAVSLALWATLRRGRPGR